MYFRSFYCPTHLGCQNGLVTLSLFQADKCRLVVLQIHVTKLVFTITIVVQRVNLKLNKCGFLFNVKFLWYTCCDYPRIPVMLMLLLGFRRSRHSAPLQGARSSAQGREEDDRLVRCGGS